jgi:DNA-binding transcriptional LysR family regulator
MELRHIRYFVAVAEELNFGKAARRLGISQPPLSQQIQSLEHELGSRLFERSRRHVALSKAGEVFLGEAYELLERSERVRNTLRRVNEGEIGQLHLAAVGSAFYEILPSILLRFRREHPEVGLSLRECETSEAESALQAGALDFAFIRLGKASSPLAMRLLQPEIVVAAIPSHHRLTREKRVSLRQLAQEPFVSFSRRASPQYYDSITAAFVNAGLSVQIMYECNGLHSKLGFVACGLGVALVPQSVTRLAIQGVAYRELKETIPLVGISVVWNTNRRYTLSERFLSVIQKIYPAARTR